MRALKRKAASRRGASITFALLLFLVCAVISSVVIVAATAAAGRMGGQAEMDERYYAVTAVAGQLRERLDGQEVTVTYEPGEDGRPIEGSTPVTSATGLLRDVSIGVLQRTEFSETNPMATIPTPGAGTPAATDKSVSCKVYKSMRADGLLTFTLKASPANNAAVVYTLELTFSPTLKESTTDALSATRTATISWKLTNIKKQRANSATA